MPIFINFTPLFSTWAWTQETPASAETEKSRLRMVYHFPWAIPAGPVRVDGTVLSADNSAGLMTGVEVYSVVFLSTVVYTVLPRRVRSAWGLCEAMGIRREYKRPSIRILG